MEDDSESYQKTVLWAVHVQVAACTPSPALFGFWEKGACISHVPSSIALNPEPRGICLPLWTCDRNSNNIKSFKNTAKTTVRKYPFASSEDFFEFWHSGSFWYRRKLCKLFFTRRVNWMWNKWEAACFLFDAKKYSYRFRCIYLAVVCSVSRERYFCWSDPPTRALTGRIELVSWYCSNCKRYNRFPHGRNSE